MLDRLLAALGVDGVQWRALVRVYLRMDFRGAGGATASKARTRRSYPLAGVAFIMLLGGATFAALVIRLPDIQVSATLLTTYGAINTVMILLVDFTGLVISPDDYIILGARPISSRTYFAARMGAVLAYITALATALAIIPSLAYALWWHLGIAGVVATLAAVVLCDVCAAVLIVATYAALMTVVHPNRLRRVFSYLQLGLMMSFYFAYYLAMQGFRDSFLTNISFDDRGWLWINPAAWFAAFVRVTAGGAPPAVWIAAAAAAALTVLCVPLASGRLSLEYAQRLGETIAQAEPGSKRGGLPVPGFRRAESRAVALLIAAQFRFDQKFRMAILGIVPLIFFYLLLGLRQGALIDPFTAGMRSAAGAPVYMAVVFMPMTLQASLQYSDAWRAAWIFFATPASAARLIIAAKNLVAVWFLGGYLLLLAGIWSFYFDRVWHAFVHAAIIGMLAHMLLQLAVLVKPALPFASEPRRGERGSKIYTVFFFGSMLAAILPIFLPVAYERPVLLAAVIAIMLFVTAGLELTLRLRVNEAIGDLEFRA
jgi:ABC-2 type transport system permease protein